MEGIKWKSFVDMILANKTKKRIFLAQSSTVEIKEEELYDF